MATVISGDTGVSQVQNNIVSPAKLTQPLTLGTAQATTSGTSIDFTGIPSWVKRITVLFAAVSTNGGSVVQVQVGAGSLTTSGYIGGYTLVVNGANPFAVSLSSGVGTYYASASDARYGSIVFTKVTENKWVASGLLVNGGANVASTASYISLSGTLDRIRITTVNGTDTFDAGSVNILYEG